MTEYVFQIADLSLETPDGVSDSERWLAAALTEFEFRNGELTYIITLNWQLLDPFIRHLLRLSSDVIVDTYIHEIVESDIATSMAICGVPFDFKYRPTTHYCTAHFLDDPNKDGFLPNATVIHLR